MMDWKTGTWQQSGLAEPTWRMTIASDWAPLNEHEPLMLEDPPAIYGDLLPALYASDLNIVNVEAVLGTGGRRIAKTGPHLSGDARAVHALTAGRFHVGCLANNHIMDLGPEGLANTRAVLEEADIAPVGAGLDPDQIRRPVVCDVQSHKVAILNCAEGESGRSVHGEPGVFGLDVMSLAQQIDRLKHQGEAEVVVVIFHGGREYIPVPPPYVVHQLRQIAEAGADAVIGHHPHVPQAVEFHHGVPIAYSLGNFAFWLRRTQLYQRLGYLLHLDFTGAKLVGLALTPYTLGPTGLAEMSEGQRAWFFQQMATAARPLERSEDVRAVWAAFVDAEGRDAPLLDNLAMLVERIKAGQDTAMMAAWLKNIFFTPAHAELYSELAHRIMNDTHNDAPDWANRLVREWAKTLYDDAPWSEPT